MKNNILLKSLLITAVCGLSILAFAGQEKVIKVFSKGTVVAEYKASDVDYIQVDDLVGVPGNIVANAEGSTITINWGAVAGATYNIFRSPDNVNFTQLASGIKETRYTDKSPLKGSNYYRVKAIVNGIESGYTESVAATLPDSDMESGIYLGISGFNDQLYKYPIQRLDENTINGFYAFIDGLTTDGATLLYYAVEDALNTMQSTQYPSDLSNVAIITFTDGLDRGSQGKTDKYLDSQDGDLDYRNDLNKRIKNQTVGGKKIEAYSIGLRGIDVDDDGKFKDNIQKLASSPQNAYEVKDMSEVNATFKEIAGQLNKRTNIQNFNVKIPFEANATVIRITFDNTKVNAENSKVWIEGTFNARTNTLENIKYSSMSFTTPVTSVSGNKDATGVYVNYSFTGIVTDNGLIFTPAATMEHIFVKATNKYQPNSEFGKEGDFVPQVERTSAAIMLVLDCSDSLTPEPEDEDPLKDNFEKAQTNAKNFIRTLYNASGDDPVNPNPPTFDSYETISVNGVSFKMIKVEGGTFTMGATPEQSNGYTPNYYETPTHSVTLSSFYMGETEVTQALWYAVMGRKPTSSGSAWSSTYGIGDDYPAYYISWNDCQEFITKLNSLTGKTFRMPTEAEWEYAARGGNQSKGYIFSGSNTIGDVAWYTGNSGSKTHPVKTKGANELGLYDMSGNVWEWCSDWYGSYSAMNQTNPTGPASGSGRVIRGGSWGYAAAGCRVADRGNDTPGNRYNNLGLRLAL